jgi:hypothetical protein
MNESALADRETPPLTSGPNDRSKPVDHAVE